MVNNKSIRYDTDITWRKSSSVRKKNVFTVEKRRLVFSECGVAGHATSRFIKEANDLRRSAKHTIIQGVSPRRATRPGRERPVSDQGYMSRKFESF